MKRLAGAALRRRLLGVSARKADASTKRFDNGDDDENDFLRTKLIAKGRQPILGHEAGRHTDALVDRLHRLAGRASGYQAALGDERSRAQGYRTCPIGYSECRERPRDTRPRIQPELLVSPCIALEDRMTPEQKALVRDTWRKVTPMAETAARLFYDRLFAIDATTRPLFKSADLAAQRRKLIQALSMVVQRLDHIEALAPTLADLGRRHVHYGVIDSHYVSVGAALLWTLEQGLGSEWTPEMKAAWNEAYSLLAGVMRGAALQRIA
jgi:hemoglobin-like flavoprotein